MKEKSKNKFEKDFYPYEGHSRVDNTVSQSSRQQKSRYKREMKPQLRRGFHDRRFESHHKPERIEFFHDKKKRKNMSGVDDSCQHLHEWEKGFRQRWHISKIDESIQAMKNERLYLKRRIRRLRRKLWGLDQLLHESYDKKKRSYRKISGRCSRPTMKNSRSTSPRRI